MKGEGFLARFIDGPLARVHGIRNLAGTPGDFELERDKYPWPLPQRLGVIPDMSWAEIPGVAMWDADNPEAFGLSDAMESRDDRVTYVKVRESQLDHDVPGVMRGAEYQLESETKGSD